MQDLENIINMGNIINGGNHKMQENQYELGWIPDYPDIRDYTDKDEEITKILEAGRTRVKRAEKPLPSAVDLKGWCSPVETQGSIQSCAAHAVAGIIEYSEKKAFGGYIDISRLFIYKATRNLMQRKGDSGAYLRSTIGAMVLFGAPPEKYYPYQTARFDEEPGAFCYAFGRNYKLIKYFRHDPPGRTKAAVLDSIKSYLSSGIPSVFGFTAYEPIKKVPATGWIPFPKGNDKILGGHAVAAVGYDDNMTDPSAVAPADNKRGALLIRNSWGVGWGNNGYGWLPYDYILQGLAIDWWSVINHEWVDTGAFMQ